jgi:hypothetical protein
MLQAAERFEDTPMFKRLGSVLSSIEQEEQQT